MNNQRQAFTPEFTTKFLLLTYGYHWDRSSREAHRTRPTLEDNPKRRAA